MPSETLTEKDLEERVAALVEVNPGQMTFEEYMRIATELWESSPVLLLVFGMGHDSRLWEELNMGGLTVFIEDKEQWISDLSHSLSIKVNYETVLSDKWRERPVKGLPEWVFRVPWDIVIVDGPEGWALNCPGRLMSIKISSAVCKTGIIFVHDIHREAERDFTKKFLGSPSEVVYHLGVWRRGKPKWWAERLYSRLLKR